jgi:hypothetical protein
MLHYRARRDFAPQINLKNRTASAIAQAVVDFALE